MVRSLHLTLLATSLLFTAQPVLASEKPPSRPAEKGCAWQHLSDSALGLAAWVQHCDFGFRKIDLAIKNSTLVERYFNSDGKPDPGEPDVVINVFDLHEGETLQAGIQRIFSEQTHDKALASQCVVEPYRADSTPVGVLRFIVVPDAKYQKTIDDRPPSDDIADPPCGDWGAAGDSEAYFEAQPSHNPRKVLYVNMGQDIPFFDEKTLRLLPTSKPTH